MEETTAQTELRRAYMLIEYGELAEALQACEAAAKKAPDSALPDTMAGSFLSSLGHHEDALKRLRKASRKAPDFALPHIYFAEASFFLGRKNVAERSLEKARRLDTDNEYSELIEQIEELVAEIDELPEPLVVEYR